MDEVAKYIILFMVYSVFGWLAEKIVVSIEEGKIVYRGFLIGPYLPIYGVGAVFVALTMNRYADDPLALFLISACVCGVLEYVTSFVLEKIFHARWWDYKKWPFNINGRICLQNLFAFGVAAILAVRYTNPVLFGFMNTLPSAALILTAVIFAVIMITDIIVSATTLKTVRAAGKKTDYDASGELKRQFFNDLSSKTYRYRRLPKAFPNFEYTKKKPKKTKK